MLPPSRKQHSTGATISSGTEVPLCARNWGRWVSLLSVKVRVSDFITLPLDPRDPDAHGTAATVGPRVVRDSRKGNGPARMFPPIERAVQPVLPIARVLDPAPYLNSDYSAQQVLAPGLLQGHFGAGANVE